MNIEYRENTLTAEEYLTIERKMGDPMTTKEQAERAIANQLFAVTALKDGQIVGIARLPGTSVSLCLMCAKGKEGFYEKLGSFRRPCEWEGAGMEMEIEL